MIKILKKFTLHADVVLGILRIFNVFLVYRRETSSGETLRILFESLFPHIHLIIDLLHHENNFVRYETFLFLRQYMSESPLSVVKHIQTLALERGELLRQIWYAIEEDQPKDSPIESQRAISIQVIGLFCNQHQPSLLVIQHMFPEVLLHFLKPDSGKILNWNKMFANIVKDTNECWLIWNKDTRQELRSIINQELSLIDHDPEEKTPWDFENFSMVYTTPKDILIGPFYIRLLIEELKRNKEFEIDDPVYFVRQLYDKLVVTEEKEAVLVIMTTIHAVVSKYIPLFKKFEHMNYLIYLLDLRYADSYWLEEVLVLLKKMFVHASNIRLFVDGHGIPVLIPHLFGIHSDTVTFDRDVSQNNTLAITINVLALIEAISGMSRYRKILCHPDYFPYIVQTLMVNQKEITKQVVIILLTLVAYCKEMQPDLHETGVFHFLMRTMNHGCNELISLFLKKYHIVVKDNMKYSFLEFFLPPCLIVLLEKDKGQVLFSDAMNSTASNPYLIWSKAHREKMVREVDEWLKEFKEQLEKNGKTLYKYQKNNPIVYDSHSEIYIENVYVRLYNQYPDCEILEPDHFLHGLINSMKDDSCLLTIILAQINLFKKYSSREYFSSYGGFPKLLEFIGSRVTKEPIKEDIELLNFVTELISTIFEKTNTNRIHFVKLDKGLDTLFVSMVKTLENLSFYKKTAYNLVHIFNILTPYVCDYVSEKPNIVEILERFFDALSEHVEIGFEAIKCISQLSKFEVLHRKMIQFGSLISLLGVGVLFTGEKGDKLQEEACLYAIQTLCNFTKSDEVITFFKQCLTDNLYYLMVEHQSEFFIKSREDISTPQIIWNEATRAELKEFLDSEMKKVGTWKIPAFAYKCLEEELMIDRLYISALKVGANLKLEHPGKFLEKIVNCISDDVTSLSKDNSENIFASILRKLNLKLEAIKSLLKEHKETLRLSEYQYINLGPIYSVIFEVIRLENSSNKNRVLTSIFEVLLMFAQDGVIWKYSKSLFLYHRLLHLISTHHDLIFEILIETCLKFDDAVNNALVTGVVVSAIYEVAVHLEGNARANATRFLGVVVNNGQNGEKALTLCLKILMNRFMQYLVRANESPDNLLDFFDEDHYAPDIVWRGNVRDDLINYLKVQVAAFEKSFQENHEHSYTWEPYPRPSLKKELLVGDIFIKSFNENPYFKVPNPEKLLSQLFARLSDELSEYIKSSDFSTQPEDLISIFIALKNIITSSSQLLTESTKYLKTIASFVRDYEEDEKVLESGLNMLAEVVRSDVAIQFLIEEKYAIHLLSMTKRTNLIKAILTVLLEMVKHSEFILQFRNAGGVLYMLKILLTSEHMSIKELSAAILSQMVSDVKYGNSMNDYICLFLTAKFGSRFESRTDKFVEFFEGSHETSGKFKKKWNDETKKELLLILDKSIKEFEHEKWDGKERFNVEIISSIYKKE